MSESRMIEKVTYGLTRGRWKRSDEGTSLGHGTGNGETDQGTLCTPSRQCSTLQKNDDLEDKIIKDLSGLKLLYRPRFMDWFVIFLIHSVLLAPFWIQGFTWAELGTKDFIQDRLTNFSQSPIQYSFFILFMVGLNVFLAKLLLDNSLTKVWFNSQEIHFENLFLSRSIVWKDIQRISFQEFRGAKAGLILGLPDGKRMKFHAVFGDIATLVYKKLKEFRPDLMANAKDEDLPLDSFIHKLFPRD